MDERGTLAANAKRLREAMGVSQKRLSKMCAVSQQTISNIEAAGIYVRLDTLAELARVFRVEVWELLAPPEVTQLLRFYRSADPENRSALLRVVKALAQPPPGAPE